MLPNERTSNANLFWPQQQQFIPLSRCVVDHHIIITTAMSSLPESSGTTASIPVMDRTEKLNLWQQGPNANHLEAQAKSRHPIDDLQRNQQDPFDLNHVRSVYGSGLAMRLATERNWIREHSTRLPGLPQSHALADTLMGRDVELDFGDFLSLPQNAPFEGDGYTHHPSTNSIPHTAMERQLGL